jgi:AraC-like DNA-binding protein
MPTRTNTVYPVKVSAPPLPAQGAIRLAPFASVPAILRELGHEPRPVLAAAGLSMEAISDPDMIVPFATIGRLFGECLAVTQCEHFGLLVGQRARLGSLGLVGFTMQSARDVGAALSNLARYHRLHDRGAQISVESDSEVASVYYSVIAPGMVALDQVNDCAVAIGCSVLRDLCGPGWKPLRVLLARKYPKKIQPYQKFFRCPLHFDAQRSGLVFQRRWLGQAPIGADALLYRHVIREAHELDDQAHISAGNFLSLVRTLLSERQCGQSEVSALLGIDRRTLGRRLRSEGTTFRKELESARFGRAKALLADPAIRSAEIAARLGYADASAFVHAFKRWAGVSPGEWRKANNHPDRR